jgi:hypothetical protein
VTSHRKSGREARALASEADWPILGRTREVEVCLSMGAKEWGERGIVRRPAPFVAAWRRDREEKGTGGPGFDAAWRGKRGRGRGPQVR